MTLLLDSLSRPLKSIRISLTDRCNFNCLYCMPKNCIDKKLSFIKQNEILTFEEIIYLVQLFVKLGVNKVRLTGGEPLLRNNLPRLIKGLSKIQNLKDIAITTNAYFLQEMALKLKQSGLHRLTVSLTTLDQNKFHNMSGSNVSIAKIINSIKVAKDVGFNNIKINCVLMKGINEVDIIPLAEFAKKNGYNIRFIEFMDSGTKNNWSLDSVIPAKEVVKIISKQWPIEKIPTDKHQVAQRWKYIDGSGEFGIIASITEPFCVGCDRIRLSANGMIYNCLFASHGLNIREYIRNNVDKNELLSILKNNWIYRNNRYSDLRSEVSSKLPKIEMFSLGG